MKRRRGICDTCGEPHNLSPNGKVVTHPSPWDKKKVCQGSRCPPESIEGEA